MESINSLGGRPAALPGLDSPAPATNKDLTNILQGLSLTIVGNPGTIDRPGGDVRVQLQTPANQLDDVPMTEFLQQVDAIGEAPAKAMIFREVVDNLAQGGRALAQAIQGEPPLDAATTEELAKGLEKQANLVEIQIRDIIENSTYPSYTDFLKELVKISQELREAASKAKLAAIENNYNTLMKAADQMIVAADASKLSREKQIEADRTKAIGEIVGGVAGVLTAWAPPGVSQAVSSIATGSANAGATAYSTESSNAQYKSDLANVAKTRLEAAAKLFEAQGQIADDLKDIGKSLRDAILRLYQDLINAQSQTIQRANV